MSSRPSNTLPQSGRHSFTEQELQTRYYSSIGGGDPAKSAKAAAADLAVLTGFLSQRGWATLTVYSSNGGTSGAGSSSAALTEADYRELDNQLDEVCDGGQLCCSTLSHSFGRPKASHDACLKHPHLSHALDVAALSVCSSVACWMAPCVLSHDCMCDCV